MRGPAATFTEPTEEPWPEFFAMAEEYAPPQNGNARDRGTTAPFIHCPHGCGFSCPRALSLPATQR